MVSVSVQGVARRPRAYVRVAGPDAEDYLQRMLSNDVSGESAAALLLTAKARVIAPVRVWRRGPDDFLLLTEPELGDVVRTELLRSRFAAKCEIEPEQHTSLIVFGGEGSGIAGDLPGSTEVLDEERVETLAPDDYERLRIEAGVPAWGKEIDESILPAEAGLDETHISFMKGCFPGQEPVARLRNRGHVNRRLRVVDVEAATPGDEISFEGRPVGRVTSAVPRVALGYVRVEVPEGAEVIVGGNPARLH